MTMEAWCEISKLLLQQCLPEGGGNWVFGQQLAAADFAALIDQESPLVDGLLIALAVAPGESEVRMLIGALSRETRIALFSRWAHYQALWQRAPADHWVPPDQLWRAVFLAMCGKRDHAIATALRIWPEANAAFPALH